MKVKFTKIVEKSLGKSPDSVLDNAAEKSKTLERIFGKDSIEKGTEDITFSDKLGELFGVDEEYKPDQIDG
jgi:hypothetical protein